MSQVKLIAQIVLPWGMLIGGYYWLSGGEILLFHPEMIFWGVVALVVWGLVFIQSRKGRKSESDN